MKKIIFTILLATSTVLFAKTEEPKSKTDLPKKEEKVFVAKKTTQEKVEEKVKLKAEGIDPHTACVIGFAYNVWTHGGNFLEAAAIGDTICP